MQALPLPDSLIKLIARIEAAGFTAYAVGGCVRDALLGRPIHDWDVTTSATPEQIKSIFADCRTIDTGIQHGTVTVLFMGDSYEITVFRVDGSYTDGRHPDAVRFSSSLKEDLARRDFTVNAMAYSPSEGIVDLFSGREDIKNQIIRAVGDPTMRFTEDALRILRALRFSSTLGFSIEPLTAKAMTALAHRLSLVSGERIMVEISKALLGKNASPVFSSFYTVASSAWHDLKDETRYAQNVALLDRLPFDLEIRLAALFLGIEQAKEPKFFLSLRFSRDIARRASNLIKEAASILPSTPYEEKKLLGAYGIDFCRQLTSLWTAIYPDKKDSLAATLSRMSAWHSESTCVSVAQLAVKGKDLEGLGIQGVHLGNWLKQLLEEVMQGHVSNEKQQLIAYVQSALSKK